MISVIDVIYKKFPYKTSAKEIQTISDYRNKHKMGHKCTMTREIIPVQFMIQEGGKTSKIEMDGETYEYYTEKMTPETNDKRRICFMANTYSYSCLCFMFGTKDSGDTMMEIQSLLNSSECVKVLNHNKKIKSGDTLMKILLKVIKHNKEFEHIKTIELSDVSKKQCYDIGLELLYLRTMTHGIPYYAKFGFRPKNLKDYEKFQANRENFKSSQKISSKDLLSIINDNKKYMKKETYFTYKKFIYPYIIMNKLIDPKIFFSELVDLIDISLEKKEYEKKNLFLDKKKLNKEEMIGLCDFASLIYKDVYRSIGYQEYNSSIWVLKLK
jgi:cyclophilin family peptidyl-prolyl cis-trans isomerase